MVLDEILFYTVDRDDKIYMQEDIERFVKSPANNKEDDFANRRYYEYSYESRSTDPNITLYRDTNATISIKNIAAYNSIRQLASKVNIEMI